MALQWICCVYWLTLLFDLQPYFLTGSETVLCRIWDGCGFRTVFGNYYAPSFPVNFISTTNSDVLSLVSDIIFRGTLVQNNVSRQIQRMMKQPGIITNIPSTYSTNTIYGLSTKMRVPTKIWAHISYKLYIANEENFLKRWFLNEAANNNLLRKLVQLRGAPNQNQDSFVITPLPKLRLLLSCIIISVSRYK